MDLIEQHLPTTEELEKTFDRLWPICRSITGKGIRESFAILNTVSPLQLFEVPTGQQVFDWQVPREWNIEEAYIEDESGNKIVDFRANNLHVLNYSTPVDEFLTLEELQKHLYSLPDQPDAIPYLTSYYKDRWGFCLSHRQRSTLKEGRYRAVIRSSLTNGSLTYAHALTGSKDPNAKEIFLSTYLCHPSMANNELSGPLVGIYLFRILSSIPNLRFRYRIAIVPETIGSITYLSKHGEEMKKSMHAGYVLTCVGDENRITYKRSRQGNAEVDRLTIHELKIYGKKFEALDFFPAGSDERQYCSPAFNLPVGSLMRSMYGTFPEYHTSLDDKNFISFEALRESIGLYLRMILSLEANRKYVNQVPACEPMLGPRGLYPTLGSQKQTSDFVTRMMWILNQADGTKDLLEIAEKATCSILDLQPIVAQLLEKGLLKPTPGET